MATSARIESLPPPVQINVDPACEGPCYLCEGISVPNPVTLEGVAKDQGDGDLSSQIHWSSDVDGHLAVGASHEVVLSEGLHTLTAQATDSDGLTGRDTVVVTALKRGAEPMDWVGEEDKGG